MRKTPVVYFIDDIPVSNIRFRNAAGRLDLDESLDNPGDINAGNPYSQPEPPPPAPAPVVPESPTNCVGSASLTQISNTTLPSGVRFQSFRVGSCVNAGFTYTLEVYSHPVTVMASAGDTPSSIASKVSAAINGTTAVAWNSSGAAPKTGVVGFKPSGSSSGDVVSVTLNQSNQFAGYASGSYAAPAAPAPVPEPPPPAAPPPVLEVEPEPEPEPPPTAPVVDEPPTADIKAISPVTLPNNVITLDGTDSSDPEGLPLSFAWSKISGPAASILAASSMVSQVTGLQAGNYTFGLTVTDQAGNTDTKTINVTVSGPTNQPPIANAGANQTIYLPTDEVLLNGSGSSDPEGTALTYSWAWINGPTEPTMTDPQKAVSKASELKEGEYDFRLTVMDIHGSTDQMMTKVFVMPPEKELIYKTSVLGGPYAGGGGGAGGGSGSGSTPTDNTARNLLWLALIAIGVSFLFFKKDSSPLK